MDKAQVVFNKIAGISMTKALDALEKRIKVLKDMKADTRSYNAIFGNKEYYDVLKNRTLRQYEDTVYPKIIVPKVIKNSFTPTTKKGGGYLNDIVKHKKMLFEIDNLKKEI